VKLKPIRASLVSLDVTFGVLYRDFKSSASAIGLSGPCYLCNNGSKSTALFEYRFQHWSGQLPGKSVLLAWVITGY